MSGRISIVVGLTAVLILAGACGGMDAEQTTDELRAAATVNPVSGTYRVTELAVPQTAQSCNFGPDAGAFFPDIVIVNNGDGTITRDYLEPGTDISICADPNNVCAGLDCTLDGRFMDCGSDPLVVDFGFFGLDAVVTFGAAFNDGQRKSDIWTKPDRWMSYGSDFMTCDGADCWLLAMMFGPEFSFPCGDVNTVVRYDLAP